MFITWDGEQARRLLSRTVSWWTIRYLHAHTYFELTGEEKCFVVRKVISGQERVRPDQLFHVIQILLCQPLASAKLTVKSQQPSNPAAKHLETRFSKAVFTQQCCYLKPFTVNWWLSPQVSVWLSSHICNRELQIPHRGWMIVGRI